LAAKKKKGERATNTRQMTKEGWRRVKGKSCWEAIPKCCGRDHRKTVAGFVTAGKGGEYAQKIKKKNQADQVEKK